jgi:hypothetical protein
MQHINIKKKSPKKFQALHFRKNVKAVIEVWYSLMLQQYFTPSRTSNDAYLKEEDNINEKYTYN